MAFIVPCGLAQLSIHSLALPSKAAVASTTLVAVQALSGSDTTGETSDRSMSFFQKNVSVYWLMSSAICIWFLFVYAPPFIIERKVMSDFPLGSHMAGAYTIYLVCLWNTLFTPSTVIGSLGHVWLGRIGMVAGFYSFCLGFYCCWLRVELPPRGFSIGITIGGIAQVQSQISGWRAIRRYKSYSKQVEELQASGGGAELEQLLQQKESSLRSHIYNMCALFMVACGTPASLRLVGILIPAQGFGSVLPMVGSVVFLNKLIKPFGDFYVKNRPAMSTKDS